MAIATGSGLKFLPKPGDHAQRESTVASNGLPAAYGRCGALKISGLEQIQGKRFVHWTPEEMAMALLLQGGQIPFRSQQEIQARLQSRDAVDEQEQMHARRARTRRGRQETVSPRSNGAQASRGRVLSSMAKNWSLVMPLTPSKATALLLWRMICAAGIPDWAVGA